MNNPFSELWQWLLHEQPWVTAGFALAIVAAVAVLSFGLVRNRRLWWAVHKQHSLIRRIAWETYTKQMTLLGYIDIEELLLYCLEQDIGDESPTAIELLQAVYYDATDSYGRHLSTEDARVIIEQYALHRSELKTLAAN